LSAGRAIDLIRREDDAFVEAQLLADVRSKDFVMIEREWSPARIRIHQRLLQLSAKREIWPESLHWDWSKKAPRIELLESRGIGIVSGDRWQGVMLTSFASHLARLPSERGKPLVYVEFLEAAPWNWRIESIGQEGLYKGIGTILMLEAIRQSQSEGFLGRLGLHALPQSEAFYRERWGMTSLGRDADKQGLPYFELAPERASIILKEVRG
jgi:hypothetical protein